MPTFSRGLAVAALIATAACNQTGPTVATGPAAPGSGVTSAGFRLPEGSGCAGEVGRYRAVIDNDLATGHVGRSVHERIAREVDQASAACAGGRDAEAVRMVDATKARFGYR